MDWEPIVRAAGLYVPEQSAMGVYLLAGAIMSDEVVCARVFELPHPDGLAMTPNGAYEIVLHAMTPEERAALKERILAKFSGKGTPSHAEHQTDADES